MSTFRKSRLLLTIVMLLASQAMAEEQTRSRETVADDLTPSVGDATPGSRLIGESLWGQDGQKIGKIVDLMIDPYYARLSSLVVEPATKTDRKRRLLVPIELVECEGESITVSRDIKAIGSNTTSLLPEGKATPYTRRMALATYRHLDLQPYWVKTVGKKPASTNQTATRDDRFFLLTNLRKQSVTDPAGEKLGHIADLVVSKTDGKIVYALLNHQHKAKGNETTRMFPIPLAAFVVPTNSGKWSIDLPEELLDNTQVVENGKLPKEINRGWVDYIHVKHGGGVFDGVQRKAKPE